jgi:hypothetical protein
MNNKSNVEKKMPSLGDGSAAEELKTLVASKLDDYTPEGIDIRRIIELSEAFDEAVENGFKGTREDFIKSLPEDELRQFFNSGGKVIDFISEKSKRKPEKSVRKLDLASQFAPDTTLAELDENQRATLNTLLKLTFGKKD